MHGRCLLLIIAGASFGAAAVPIPKEDDATRLSRSYGAWIDPDRDCKFAFKGDELRLSLPRSMHLLGTHGEALKHNAPRILREVKGDFSVLVRVAFPCPENMPGGFWVSGGLMAWESEKDYFAIQRCYENRNDGNQEKILFQQVNSVLHSSGAFVLGKQANAIYVRLEREGPKVRTSWSRDGKQWQYSPPEGVDWGAKVKVGLVAENCSGSPAEITFDKFTLTLPKK